MIRSFRSELVKLGRPTVLYGAGAVLPFLAVLATALAFLNASDGPVPPGPDRGFSLSLAELSNAGGLTLGFTGVAGLLGILVFVLFLTSVTGEHSQGTLRTLLVREPRRGRLLAGKLVALVLLTAVSLLVAELFSAGTSLVAAQLRDVPTSQWFGVEGLQRAAGDYANALLTASFFGLSGAMVGVLVRSTSIGLAVGLAWLLPLEHIIQNSWADAARWFPGLLFDAVAQGGTAVTPYGRGLAGGVLVAGVLVVVGTTAFIRRDVSA